MTDIPTEAQTTGGQSTSQRLSMRATTPPAEVPGYRLSRFLGSGAFGQVWVGRDLNTGRDVAVKFYLHRGGVNWSLLTREVKNLVQLSADRNVVQVLEVGWDADPPYYVMELIGGGSLEDKLIARGRIPAGESVQIFREILTGLNHCHARGVLHCDLKPANVLLDHDGRPRLADFGQSRLSNDQTPALGTLFYMAPEQADLVAAPDAAWDVYAAGALMYRMLTGGAPHRDDAAIEKIDTAGSLPRRLEHYRELIAASPPPTGHFRVRGVDRALGRILSRCLAVDPADRYENVQQILQDLSHRDDARARRPLMWLGIVGPLLILLAATLFGARSIRQASDSTIDALSREAAGSNDLAAEFAARTLESEIGGYYAGTEAEARRDELRQKLRDLFESEEATTYREQLNAMEFPAATQIESATRERFLDDPVRADLETYLSGRLRRFTGGVAASRPLPLSTMFITDSVGTIVAAAFDEPVAREESSAGRNFGFRTYFHGGQIDFGADQITIGEVEPLRKTHLSAPFKSTATRRWKTAVSTPIFLTEASRRELRPDALFVVTINLGAFEVLRRDETANQFAVLVDARQGDSRGTILQHPWMDEISAAEEIPDERFRISPDLMDDLIAGDDDVRYIDPVATVPGAASYGGQWLAALKPVALPGEIGSGGEAADLLVLVQYRLDKVLQPVERMRASLLLEGAVALLSILLVALALFWFVRRVSTDDLRSHVVPTKPPTTTTDPTLSA